MSTMGKKKVIFKNNIFKLEQNWLEARKDMSLESNKFIAHTQGETFKKILVVI